MKEKTPATFLTANWSNLVFLSYEINDAMLLPYVPPGLELDRYQERAIVSLVAFQFLNTRLSNIPVPFFHSFSELNLRFYVRDPVTSERGVVFIHEVCPYRVVSWTARLFFNEKLTIKTVRSEITKNAAVYTLPKCFQTKESLLKVTFGPDSNLSSQSTFEHFIVERYHGFGVDRRGKTIKYHVSHEPWHIHHAVLETCSIDFTMLYGSALAKTFENSVPCSIFYSPGSRIALSYATARQ